VSTARDSDLPTQRARVLWQLTFDLEVRTTPVALADGLVITLAGGDTSVLRRLALDGGAPVWSTDLHHQVVGSPVRTGSLLAVPLAGGHIGAFDVADGAPLRPAWAPLPTPAHAELAAAGGRVFARCGHGVDATLSCYLVGQSRPAWVVPDPASGGEATRMRTTNGVLVVASAREDDGVVIAGVDVETGHRRWLHREAGSRLHDLWAIGGIVDVVTSSGVIGLEAATGEHRTTRFAGFPLDSARAVGEHLVAMMEGHMGPVLLCFHIVTQRLIGRISRAMTRLVGAHAGEVLVTLINGEPIFYAIPSLEPLDLPEAEAISPPGVTAWSRDVSYVVSLDQHTVTAIDLDAPERPTSA